MNWKWKVKVKVVHLCLTLCKPMDCRVHGILQAIILEWIAFPFSRGSSQPRDRTQVSCIKVFMNWKGAIFTHSSQFLWWVHSFSASRGQHLQANHNAEFLPPCLTKRLPPPVCGSSGGTLSPPCWLFLGAKWALGHFLPTSHCNHSSVPNKTLFCLMPGPLLWRTGLSPTSLNRDFPGSIVVRTPCFHCRDCGFSPWSKK